MSDVTGTTWFLISILSVTVSADVFDLNKQVDEVLNQYREAILETNDTWEFLPKIRVQYSEKVLFFSVKGDFNGTHGTISDFSTLRRTSNASLVTVQEYFVFRAEFGLEDLKVKYKYNGRFMGIPLSGELDLNIGANSLYVEILLNVTDDRCSGSIEKIRQVRFTSLDRVSVKVSGFSLANRFVDYLLSRSFNHVSPNVIRPLEEFLKTTFKDRFRHFDFCKFGSIPENKPFDDAKSSADTSSQMYPENSNSTVPDVSAVMD